MTAPPPLSESETDFLQGWALVMTAIAAVATAAALGFAVRGWPRGE